MIYKSLMEGKLIPKTIPDAMDQFPAGVPVSTLSSTTLQKLYIPRERVRKVKSGRI